MSHSQSNNSPKKELARLQRQQDQARKMAEQVAVSHAVPRPHNFAHEADNPLPARPPGLPSPPRIPCTPHPRIEHPEQVQRADTPTSQRQSHSPTSQTLSEARSLSRSILAEARAYSQQVIAEVQQMRAEVADEVERVRTVVDTYKIDLERRRGKSRRLFVEAGYRELDTAKYSDQLSSFLEATSPRTQTCRPQPKALVSPGSVLHSLPNGSRIQYTDLRMPSAHSEDSLDRNIPTVPLPVPTSSLPRAPSYEERLRRAGLDPTSMEQTTKTKLGDVPATAGCAPPPERHGECYATESKRTQPADLKVEAPPIATSVSGLRATQRLPPPVGGDASTHTARPRTTHTDNYSETDQRLEQLATWLATEDGRRQAKRIFQNMRKEEPVAPEQQSGDTRYMATSEQPDTTPFRSSQPAPVYYQRREAFSEAPQPSAATVANQTQFIHDLIARHLERSEPGRSKYIKHLRLSQPSPYYGADDIEVFILWLQEFIRWLRMVGLTGPENDSERILVLGQVLTGEAREWFYQVVDPAAPSPGQPQLTFEEALCALFGRFVHKSSVKLATEKYSSVEYSWSRGTAGLINDILKHGSRMVCMPDEYSVRRHLWDCLPSEIVEVLGRLRGLSPEYSTRQEIVDNAIEVEDAMQTERHRWRDLLPGSISSRETSPHGTSHSRTHPPYSVDNVANWMYFSRYPTSDDPENWLYGVPLAEPATTSQWEEIISGALIIAECLAPGHENELLPVAAHQLSHHYHDDRDMTLYCTRFTPSHERMEDADADVIEHLRRQSFNKDELHNIQVWIESCIEIYGPDMKTSNSKASIYGDDSSESDNGAQGVPGVPQASKPDTKESDEIPQRSQENQSRNRYFPLLFQDRA